ncbi:MAG: DUF2786 domain-containing protein [Bacilli bacterium]
MDKVIVEKVRKLLALSGNNQSAEEAQSALAKARELMVKHGIEAAALAVAPVEPNVKEHTIYEGARILWWVDRLAVILAEAFRCYVWNVRRPNRRLVVLGAEDDVAIVQDAHRYAVQVVPYLVRRYRENRRRAGQWPTNRSKATAIENKLIQGFCAGLKDQFRKQEQQPEWALVLTKHPVVQDAYQERRDALKLRAGKPARVLLEVNAHAYSHGYEVGRAFAKPEGMLE